MPFYTGYIPGIYLSHEIVRSARLQNLDCNAAAHRYWIARVFNVLQNVAAVPLGIRQPDWGPGSGVVSDTTTITITPEYNFGRPQPRIGGLLIAETEGVRRQSRSETSRCAAETRKARKRAVDQIWQTYTWYLPVICTNSVNRAFRGFMTCLPHWHLYVHAGAKLWW